MLPVGLTGLTPSYVPVVAGTGPLGRHGQGSGDKCGS